MREYSDTFSYTKCTKLILKIRSSKFNDDRDRPFQKANGEWTYFANDVAYHYDKISRNFKQLINIWGADHIGYIHRMKSIVDVIINQKKKNIILTLKN